MTRYHCDICKKQIFSANQISVLLAPSVTQTCDLCGDCLKAIKEAKNKAEIEIIKELGRQKNE